MPRVVVTVMPKAEILDPQGQAIVGALGRLGHPGVSEVRQGKRFELEVDDTVTDDDGNSFYEIKLRTNKSHLGTEEHPLLIIPGMVASVDIITGKKSVLSYLLKPIIRAQSEALRER